MRITLISHFPGRGGSTTMLLQVQEFLESRGHHVAVVVGDPCETPLVSNYRVVPRPVRGGWRARLREYRTTIEATQPDMVYSISGKDEFDVLRFLRCARVRHLFSLERHEYADLPYWVRQMDGYTEAITANTPDVLESLGGLGLRDFHGWLAPYRFGACFLAAPVVVEEDERAKLRPIEICFAGRLEAFQKRADWLAKIVPGCVRAGCNLQWHIYGTGPLEAELQRALASPECGPQVRFHGWVSPDEMARRLPSHDLFFLCSRWEGLPIALVEAMLCGLAGVAPRIPAGITYALESGGGWLYEAAAPEAAVVALREAVTNREELRRRRAEAQRRARSVFAGPVVEQQLSELESQLMQLRFNGRALELGQAPRLRAVRPYQALRRRLRDVLRGRKTER